MADVAAQIMEASMSAYKAGAAFIAAATLVVWAGSSRAEPPPPMWAGDFKVPVVICDTKDQAEGSAKQVEGKVQNAWGKVKDSVKKPSGPTQAETDADDDAEARRDRAANE